MDVVGLLGGAGHELQTMTVGAARQTSAASIIDAQWTSASCGVEPYIIQGQTQPPVASTSRFGQELTIHLLRLLDVPRRQAARRYMVRLFDRSGIELGHVDAEGQPGDGEETVEFGPMGAVRLHTMSPLLRVDISYSDGQVLGSCQIHRLDPRSAGPSAYALLDAHGHSANCGIELQVSEIAHPPPECFSQMFRECHLRMSFHDSFQVHHTFHVHQCSHLWPLGRPP